MLPINEMKYFRMKGGRVMKGLLYVIAIIAGIVGIIGSFVTIPYVNITKEIASYLVMGGFALLAIGYLIKKK